jgi:hypothetical protein
MLFFYSELLRGPCGELLEETEDDGFLIFDF